MIIRDKIGYLFVITTMLIWGSIGLFVRLVPAPSELIVFYRVLFAFIFLLLMSAYNRKLTFNLQGNNKLLVIGMGVTLALNWIFFFQAIKTTTIASATLSYYLAPVIVTVLSVLFLDETITRRGLVALGLSVIGIGSMVLDPHNFTLTELRGIGYGLIAAFCYALFTLSNKLVTNLSAQFLTLLQTGIAILILFPFVLGYQMPEFKSLLILAIMGIIHTALALILYVKGLRLSKMQDVGVLSYLDPVSAILFAFIFIGEVPDVSTLAGGILILMSSYLVISK